MTRLILMRHGIAEDASRAPGGRDAERRLTEEGEAQVHRVALGLGAFGSELFTDAVGVAHSPLVRTTQTAGILVETLRRGGHPVGACEPADLLAPGAQGETVLSWIREQGGALRIVVGHEPDLGALAGWLVSGRASPGMPFRKAGVCIIGRASAGPGMAALEAFLPPGVMERLGKGGPDE